jgi:hypothetical protein
MLRYDEGLPRGFQDADFEASSLHEIANQDARLRARGICTHGWRKDHSGNGTRVECLNCGKIATAGTLDEERAELLY